MILRKQCTACDGGGDNEHSEQFKCVECVCIYVLCLYSACTMYLVNHEATMTPDKKKRAKSLISSLDVKSVLCFGYAGSPSKY